MIYKGFYLPARACWPAAAVAPCWFACCFACVSAVRACRITASETLVSRPLDAQPLRSSSFPHFTNNRLLLLLVILLLLLPSLHPHVVFCFLFCVFSLFHCCLSPPHLCVKRADRQLTTHDRIEARRTWEFVRREQDGQMIFLWLLQQPPPFVRVEISSSFGPLARSP